jgi:membrane-bound lytic murein transglycosylase D
MRAICLLMLLLCVRGVVRAQEQTVTLEDLVQSAQAWARTNLDENVVQALQDAAGGKARRLLDEIQKRFQGEYVIDLAPLRGAALASLPVLERYEETLPYALWLKTQLDYLDVAEQFQLIIKPPKAAPGQPAPPPPNPTPQQERQMWAGELARRPSPANAKAYVARLEPVFAAHAVPPALVWMAEVESSFDPRVRSPAGAAGLFQLMPATARRYGLSSRPRDQRLDPDKSAEAAAKYLDYLHRHFKDWRLALAAYNAGEGAIDKLLQQHRATTFDAIAAYLPAETQMYVPRIEATLLRRQGIKLSQL